MDAGTKIVPEPGEFNEVLIGDTLYFLPEFVDGEAFDRSHYRVVFGRDLPAELEALVVVSHRGAHVIHVPDGAPSISARSNHQHFSPEGELLEHPPLCRHWDGEYYELPPDHVIQRKLSTEELDATSAAQRGGGLSDEVVQYLVDQVDTERWYQTVVTLATANDLFQRYSTTEGFRDMRDWMRGEFDALGFTTEIQPFSLGSNTSYNVVATLTGTTLPDEFVVVGAHLDSLPSPNPPQDRDSPGAEDNGSGSAALLEIARTVSLIGPSQRTIVIVAFGGEEQGLVGSAHYVSQLSTSERNNLVGAIIMDMIGYSADSEYDVLLETAPSDGGTLRSAMSAAGSDFVGGDLVQYSSNFPFGSDHMPFLNADLPAVLAIQNDWDSYPQYHRSSDTVSAMVNAPTGSKEQGANIVRMNVGTVARLANPNTPPSCDFVGSDDKLPEVAMEGGSEEFDITCDATCLWEVTGLPEWITAEPTKGLGDATITFTFAENEGEPRSTDAIQVGTWSLTATQAGEEETMPSGLAIH